MTPLELTEPQVVPVAVMFGTVSVSEESL